MAAAARHRLPAPLVLTALLLALSGVGHGKTHTSTRSAQTTINAADTSYSCGSCTYSYLSTSSSGASTYQSMFTFPFSTVATGFCASSVKFRVSDANYCIDDWIFWCDGYSDPPSKGTGTYTYEAVKSNSWSASTTFATRPTGANVITSAVASASAFTSEGNYWYSMNLPVNLINTAVANDPNKAFSFRLSRTGTQVGVYLERSSSTYAATVAVTYENCHANADCVNGACICKTGYTGNGLTCAVNTNLKCPSVASGSSATGYATWPETNVQQEATGTCITNYGGTPKRSCGIGGVWAAPSVSCTINRCSAENAGNAAWVQTDAGTTATGFCAADYHGSPTRPCQSNGSWGSISNPCQLRTCSATSTTAYTLPLANSSTTVTGTCRSENGYIGTVSGTCTPSGWTVTNNCVFSACPTEQYANASWPLTFFNQPATGTCLDGFEGSVTRNCLQGVWSTDVVGMCKRRVCASGSGFNADWSATESEQTATGTCHARYTGTPKRVCLVTGTWSSTVTDPCVLRTCPAGPFGGFDWPQTDAGTNGEVTCPAGTVGSPRRPCDVSGNWGSVIGGCTQLYCPPLVDNTVSATWTQTAANTNNVAGTCHPGFSGTISRTCDASGEWGPVTGSCGTLQCEARENDGNAQWPESPARSEYVQGTCNAGWTGSPYRNCDANGNWQSISNPCTQKTCTARNEYNAAWPVTAAGQTAEGTCNQGYAQSPKPTRVCGESGWETTVTNPCQQLRCSETPKDGITFPETPAGGIATGDCPEGSYGTPMLKCKLDGTWEDTITNPCAGNPCPAIELEEAYWLEAEEFDKAIPGTCKEPYKMNNEQPPTRICYEATKEWSEISNPCIRRTCDATTDNTVFASWPTVEAVTENVPGECLQGYTGVVSRTCDIEGWSSITGSCTRIQCAEVTEGNAVWPTTNSGTIRTGIECSAGYEGSPSRQCSWDGHWEAIQSPCTRRKCGESSLASASFPETLSGETATGVCVAGYTGAPTRVCKLDGTWEDSTAGTACLRRTCPELPNDGFADWNQTFAGDDAQGTCVDGYDGSPTRSCSLNGVWSSISNPCTRNMCPEEPTSFNAYWPETPSLSTSVIGTCLPGFVGSPVRDCSNKGTWSDLTNGTCTQLVCPTLVEENANWVQTIANTTKVGACVDGWEGEPYRECTIAGVWGPVQGECTQRMCPNETVQNAVWEPIAAGSTQSGHCVDGYVGDPKRVCNLLDGKWGPVTNPCRRLTCPAQDADGNAQWSQANSGDTAYGTCLPTFGNAVPSRKCHLNGTWGEIDDPCQELTCVEGVFGNASWPTTRAGTTATGVCVTGFFGTPLRQCGSEGGWSSTLDVACQPIVPNCPFEVVNGTTFATTRPGSTTTGFCATGFTGEQTRYCDETGQWGPVSGECLFTPSNATRIRDVRVISRTSSSVTIGWELADNATDTFLAYYTTQGRLDFVQIGTGYFNETRFTATGLSEYTLYHFRVYAGINETMDDEPAQLSARTDILPPSDLKATILPENVAVKLEWEPSPLAEYYEVSYIILTGGNARAIDDDNRVVVKTNLTDTSYQVAGVAAGATYTFMVHAGLQGTLESTGASVTYPIPSTVDQVIVDETKGMYIGIGAGIAVLVLIVVVIVSIIVYRRRQRRNKEVIKEFHSQFSMATFSSAALLPGADPNTARRTIPRTSTMSSPRGDHSMVPGAGDLTMSGPGGDSTVINTVLEIALPGFLRLDFNKQLRTDAQLGSGGAGVIFKGTLLDTQITSRTGFSEVAIKEVTDWPTLTDEENEERFHQEVSLMWSLSFHPSIIQLIGYTDNPRTIITPIYATDLFRFLHSTEESHIPLESPLFLHFAANIASGLNAIHSMNVAHRDMKTANVLLRAPIYEHSYPDPIICDFGLARAGDTGIKKANVIVGFSPRYAAPEVFARAHVKGLSSTVEDDKKSDVYAFGVMVWEMYMRQIPWGDISNDDIEMKVRSGQQLPPLPPAENDPIRLVMTGVVTSALAQVADRRPAMAVLNSKIASLLPQE